jgi:hypothetical protein
MVVIAPRSPQVQQRITVRRTIASAPFVASVGGHLLAFID